MLTAGSEPPGNFRVVEVRQSAARILEAEFIDFVVADRPGVLEHSGDVAVGLLRGARVGVLSEGLILAADFDAGDRAGADVSAERQAMIGAEVVIDAQRVEAGAFEDGEIAFLRSQRLIGSRDAARQVPAAGSSWESLSNW